MPKFREVLRAAPLGQRVVPPPAGKKKKKKKKKKIRPPAHPNWQVN